MLLHVFQFIKSIKTNKSKTSEALRSHPYIYSKFKFNFKSMRLIYFYFLVKLLLLNYLMQLKLLYVHYVILLQCKIGLLRKSKTRSISSMYTIKFEI